MSEVLMKTDAFHSHNSLSARPTPLSRDAAAAGTARGHGPGGLGADTTIRYRSYVRGGAYGVERLLSLTILDAA